MFQRARNRMTQVIEQNSAERIAKELDAGKLQATLVWNPSGEPRFLLDIRRPTDTKSMLVLVGYKEDSTNEWETILCPIPADAPAIDARGRRQREGANRRILVDPQAREIIRKFQAHPQIPNRVRSPSVDCYLCGSRIRNGQQRRRPNGHARRRDSSQRLAKNH